MRLGLEIGVGDVRILDKRGKMMYKLIDVLVELRIGGWGRQQYCL